MVDEFSNMCVRVFARNFAKAAKCDAKFALRAIFEAMTESVGFWMFLMLKAEKLSEIKPVVGSQRCFVGHSEVMHTWKGEVEFLLNNGLDRFYKKMGYYCWSDVLLNP